MAAPVDKTCRSTDFFTPKKILDPIRRYFADSSGVEDIELDPATTCDNPTDAYNYYTKDTDGLENEWAWSASVFVNPPYGAHLKAWVKKIREEAEKGGHIIALLPGQRFETAYWQQDVFNPHLSAICFVRSRIAFEDESGTPMKSNPYGSMLYLYNGVHTMFTKEVGVLGKIIIPVQLN